MFPNRLQNSSVVDAATSLSPFLLWSLFSGFLCGINLLFPQRRGHVSIEAQVGSAAADGQQTSPVLVQSHARHSGRSATGKASTLSTHLAIQNGDQFTCRCRRRLFKSMGVSILDVVNVHVHVRLCTLYRTACEFTNFCIVRHAVKRQNVSIDSCWAASKFCLLEAHFSQKIRSSLETIVWGVCSTKTLQRVAGLPFSVCHLLKQQVTELLTVMSSPLFKFSGEGSSWEWWNTDPLSACFRSVPCVLAHFSPFVSTFVSMPLIFHSLRRRKVMCAVYGVFPEKIK